MKKQLLALLMIATVAYTQEEIVETTETNTEAVEMVPADSMETSTNEMVTNEVVANDMMTNESVEPMYVSTVGYTITNGEHLYASPNARFEVQGVDEQSGLKEILVSVDGSAYAPYKEPVGFTKDETREFNKAALTGIPLGYYSLL